MIDTEVIKPVVEWDERLQHMGAPGVHIFVLSDVELCQLAMEQLKEKFE